MSADSFTPNGPYFYSFTEIGFQETPVDFMLQKDVL